MGMLSQMVHNQVREMAYLDPFMIFCVMALASLPLVLLMQKIRQQRRGLDALAWIPMQEKRANKPPIR